MRKTLLLVAALAIATPAAAYAMGGSSPAPVEAMNPDFTAGKKSIDTKDWAGAIDAFSRVVAKEPKNADAFNYLGFAFRNQGNYDMAFKHYASALDIDPKHKGAHEYVGEAYIKIGNLAKAEEHLKALDRICMFGCAEYTELKTKLNAAKANKPS